MDEVDRISDQLRRSFDGEAWHGPAVGELLVDVDEKKASAKPMENVHSIWEIVLHIAAWESAALDGIQGKPVDLSDEEDWPIVSDYSESAWQAALAHLKQTHARLLNALNGIDENDLRKIVPNRDYSVYFLLHGTVQHNLYHAGQIAILKKA